MESGVSIVLKGITKQFRPDLPPAIADLSAEIKGGQITGIVGPDGAGKTTLLRLMAGLLIPTKGEIVISGKDSNASVLISYMPQKFGLYEDLTVMENLNLYADLRGVFGKDREVTIEQLLEFTGLSPFTDRLAGRLSGGMKQKLGLACSLVQHPDVLLLDEPSVGVDPLSRRELWQIVYELVRDGITVVWSTAYLDEAQQCSDVLVLDEGKLLFKGLPEDLTSTIEGHTFLVSLPERYRREFAIRAVQDERILDSVIQGKSVRIVTKREISGVPQFYGEDYEVKLQHTSPRFEDAVISLMGGISRERVQNAQQVFKMDRNIKRGEVVVKAQELTKRFGTFVAVNGISFEVKRGEVFGLLGPNGAGKSTTFKMLCGLLKPTFGKAMVAGVDLLKAPSKARERIGYMAQKFSLYGDLSVKENLEFFGGVYGIKGRRLREVVDSVIHQFQLEPFVDTDAEQLPLGFKQRLSMACATMHEPAILFLDEPTSGVDPITRREFWIRINSMVQSGVSVIVTTHFLDEAEYCDRLALVYRGEIIAKDTPDGIKEMAKTEEMPEPTLEEAFIELIKRSTTLVSGRSV